MSGVHLEAGKGGWSLWEIASSSPGAIPCMRGRGSDRRAGVHPTVSAPHFSNYSAEAPQPSYPTHSPALIQNSLPEPSSEVAVPARMWPFSHGPLSQAHLTEEEMCLMNSPDLVPFMFGRTLVASSVGTLHLFVENL